MAERSEHCQYAFRKRGDPNVHCRILEANPKAKGWAYCVGQYDCRASGRWEAPVGKCKIRERGD